MPYFYLLFILILISPTLQANQTPGQCLSDDESTLLALVNDYRSDNGLTAIPRSNVLNTVGQWHAEDAFLNSATIFIPPCNLHSWSNDMPHLWSAMCYTPDHAQAQKMWDKPREISGGSFIGNGYENAAWGYATPAAALNGWKNSPGHNEVILNQGIWSNITWRAMGVGIRGAYYYLWFSDSTENSSPLPPCIDEIFSNGFE
jgi:Uncharacterized protein with SCP/PR1 domains